MARVLSNTEQSTRGKIIDYIARKRQFNCSTYYVTLQQNLGHAFLCDGHTWDETPIFPMKISCPSRGTRCFLRSGGVCGGSMFGNFWRLRAQCNALFTFLVSKIVFLSVSFLSSNKPCLLVHHAASSFSWSRIEKSSEIDKNRWLKKQGF